MGLGRQSTDIRGNGPPFCSRDALGLDAEHNCRKLAGENPQILQATRRIKMVLHPETGLLTTGTASILSSVNGAEKRSSMITSSLPEVSDAEERVSAITSSLPGDRRGRTSGPLIHGTRRSSGTKTNTSSMWKMYKLKTKSPNPPKSNVSARWPQGSKPAYNSLLRRLHKTAEKR
jgi:hypothetical protein